MLRALAGLGVVHEPDFSSEMVAVLDGVSVEQQLSRSGAIEAVNLHGPALMLALIPAPRHERISAEEMHLALHGLDHEARTEFLGQLVKLREGRDDGA